MLGRFAYVTAVASTVQRISLGLGLSSRARIFITNKIGTKGYEAAGAEAPTESGMLVINLERIFY